MFFSGYSRLIALFVPAAGEANDGEVNNVGDNGIFWSSSLNEDNANNAWNCNFNDNEANMDNNNRCYGNSVRAVRGGTTLYSVYILSKITLYKHVQINQTTIVGRFVYII